jgi:hypothetical protein
MCSHKFFKKNSLYLILLFLTSCFNSIENKIEDSTLTNQEKISVKYLETLYIDYKNQYVLNQEYQENLANITQTYDLLLSTSALVNSLPTLDNIYNILTGAIEINNITSNLTFNSIVFINQPLSVSYYDEIQNICVFNYKQQYQFSISLPSYDKDCNNYSNNIIIKKEAGIYSYTNQNSNIISIENYSFQSKPNLIQLNYYNQVKNTLASFFTVDIVINKDLLNNNYLLKNKYIIYLRYINDYAKNHNFDNYYNHNTFLINKHLILKNLLPIYEDKKILLDSKLDLANKQMIKYEENSNLTIEKKNYYDKLVKTTTIYCENLICLVIKTDKLGNLEKKIVKKDVVLDSKATIAYLLTLPISLPISIVLLFTNSTSPFILHGND